MRYLFVTLLGSLLGATGAGAVLFYNPLTESGAIAPSAADRVLRYTLPDHVLEFALGEDARFLGQDPGADSLWEETIDRTAVLGLVLNGGDDQPAAVASRLIAASPETDLLLRGVLVSDHWLVTIPGEGTLFVRSDSNLWPFVKQTLVPVWYFDRPWQGPVEYLPTVGPGSANTAIVLGVAGSFDGLRGSAVERYQVTDLDPAERSAAAAGELHLQLRGPQVATQE